MSPALRDQELLELAAPIMASPADDSAWSDAFSALLLRVPARLGVMLHLPMNGAPRFETISAFFGLDEGRIASYREDFSTSTAWQNCHTLNALRQADGCLRTEHLPGLGSAGASRLRTEVVRAHDSGLRGLAAVRDLSEGSQLHFTLLRHADHTFAERERKLCDGFLFIASRMLEQRMKICRLERERTIACALAENAGDAVFVLDAERRIEFMNSAAHNWLEHAAVVCLQADRLQFQAAADSRWLREQVATLLPDDVKNGRDGLRYRRIHSTDNAAGIFAVLSRLPILPAMEWSRGKPRAALYLRCVEEAMPQLSEKDLADLFGLTVTESRVVNALLMGITVEQMAQQWSIRSDTVRGHLKRILVKTDCSRQQDLIQIVTKAMPYLLQMNDSAD